MANANDRIEDAAVGRATEVFGALAYQEGRRIGLLECPQSMVPGLPGTAEYEQALAGWRSAVNPNKYPPLPCSITSRPAPEHVLEAPPCVLFSRSGT